ncbi:MAG: efflux RND transporter periplasmic adaptor subunit [Candidatus Pacebacteria bacterium]|nr:efflux RND transporter periplasmic adaptor subunit [Candidatus Paceibacterota bacterium]
MKKSHFRHLKNKWVIIGIIVILIAAGIYYEKAKPKKPNFQYATAAIGNVVEQVSVTGTVSPVENANLAFEKGGVITKIFVKVGDTVKAGDPVASLDSASDQAAVASAKATLADMSSGLTPQQYAAYQSAVSIASTTLANSLSDAVNAIHTGYVEAQSSVVNYGDAFFTNPQTANPTINIRTQSNTIALAINNERLQIGIVLNNWQLDSSSANASNTNQLVSNAEGYLSSIKSYLTDLATIVDNLSPGNSGLPQSAIDSAVASMNTALSTLNQAVGTISAADTELKNASSGFSQAENTFALQQSGSTPDAVAAQAAKVAQAEAVLAEDTLTSPIDGIVTQEDPNVGEYVAPGQSGFAVQNSGFKVEAYVAEADIAKVAVGDLASSTLDAYGAYVNFPEKVVMIDPAETVLEGVPTYKVTLQFISPDSRIKSGMTSNIEILTHETDNVLEIPYRALLITSTSTDVRLVSTNGLTYSSVPVTTGLKGSDGSVQILSGLKPGDKVVTYIGS